MPIAIRKSKTFVYVLARERGTPKPTKFHLRVLDLRSEEEIQDALVIREGDSTRVLAASASTKALKLGLVGVDDFFDDTGAPVEFETEPVPRKNPTRNEVTDAFLGLLSTADRQEIGNAIIERNFLTGAEEKNSSSPGV